MKMSLAKCNFMCLVFLLFGCSINLGTQTREVSCQKLAPLNGNKNDRELGYIVVFKDDVDSKEIATTLAAAHGFVIDHIYEYTIKGFAAKMSDTSLAAVRCESAVKYVEYDQISTTD